MPTDETSTTNVEPNQPAAAETPVRRTRRRAASRPAGPPQQTSPPPEPGGATDATTAAPPPAKKATTRRASKQAPTGSAAPDAATEAAAAPEADPAGPVKRTSTRKRATKPAVLDPVFQAPDPVDVSTSEPAADPAPEGGEGGDQPATSSSSRRRRSRGGRNRRKSSEATVAAEGAEPPKTPAAEGEVSSAAATAASQPKSATAEEAPAASDPAASDPGAKSSSKSTRSSSKGSSKSKAKASGSPEEEQVEAADDAAGSTGDGSGGEPKDSDEAATTSSSSRRRRRRRRSGSSGDSSGDGGAESTASTGKAREPRTTPDSISGVEGSTRIEAKKQRRREGREAGRRRAPILSESEFLARRESVDRAMVIRQREDVTQIAVLEDNVLVEHYVALETESSLIGNVYLGRVQNVLPSMEAAFIDIGKGRNAVLYAGEVNWDLIGDRNQPRRIENALKSGQQILVQVSKDPVGHKGARLTSQISLPGRYLVYVPGGGSSGISRKLPDVERSRLKSLLKEILPDESGVIIRTAAEGATEEELTRDAQRLTARWAEIQKLVKSGKAPTLLYAEPDITLKVVRDLFTEDFAKLVVSGDEAWTMVDDYVSYVAPDLKSRLERYEGAGDVFADHRVDEQIAKALERKVWLPSGGSLVIDRTEAMTVVDVNTGKFTGSGGNLEQTVTKNNLEAAEEIVRQLRLRDIGGIIVIDFIDMVLENNRDLVLRRLVECLGRDRTRHQVAEVTSLGLVQMTRKRIGTGLVESFSVPCEVCHGRGAIIEAEPVKAKSETPASGRGTSKRSSSRQRSASKSEPTPEQPDPAAIERHSAAAAATAVIAAALRSESRPDLDAADPVEVIDHEAPVETPAPAKKPAAKKSAAKKTGTTKTTTKSAAKKSAAKKTGTTKAASAKTASAKTSPAKATATKKSATKATAAKKAPAKTPAKATVAKKSTTKATATKKAPAKTSVSA